MFDPLWKFLRRAGGALLLLAGLFIAAELARVALMAYRFQPLVGLGVAALIVLAIAVLLIRWIASACIPAPMSRPDPDQAGAAVLIRYANYLIRYLAYLGQLPALDRDTRKLILRGAADIEDLLRAHPLKDDLARLLDQSARDILTPVFKELQARCNQRLQPMIAETMRDALQGPYTAFSPANAFWQALRTTAVALRVYHPYVTFREWAGLFRRIQETVGAFPLLKTGRLLAQGLASQTVAQPATANDTARALSVGWMLLFARQTAWAVCEEGAGLRPIRAEAWRDKECFLQAAEIFITDLAPQMKNRLRTNGDPHGEMPFLDHLSGALQVAFESTLRHFPEDGDSGADTSRREPAEPRDPERPANDSAHRHRRHRRHSRRSGSLSMLFTLGQRIKYGLLGHRINRQGL